MKTRSKLSLLLSSCVLLTALASYAATETKSASPSPTKSTEKPKLAKGMTTEAIVALIGRPVEITPMKTDTGKAETWIYRRVIDTKTTQVASSTQSVPAFLGINKNGADIGTTTIPQFHFKKIITFQVTTLLIFEGKLVVAKQSIEQSESFAN